MKSPANRYVAPSVYQVESRMFCAGLVVRQDGIVMACAPILRDRFFGRTFEEVKSACKLAGWKLTRLNENANVNARV